MGCPDLDGGACATTMETRGRRRILADNDRAESPGTGPVRTPPPQMNAIMRLMLRTPVLQGWFGKSTALVAFTGGKCGLL